MDRLKECLDSFVLPHEGIVFENVPGDPGGATCCGITQSDYDTYRVQNHLPKASVKNLMRLVDKKNTPTDEVYDIYKHHYWMPLRCDLLKPPLDLIAFDTGVNMGVGVAKRFLKVTRNTTKYLELRKDRYQFLVETHPPLKKFLKGWLNRVADLAKLS